AVLVSGDEDFVYAVNAVAYKGCRVEVAGFRSNTAPKLIDVADYFIDLGEIADKVRKEFPHTTHYHERDLHDEAGAAAFMTQDESQPNGHPDGFNPPVARVIIESTVEEEEMDQYEPSQEFIRITDDH
ncbi:MAG: NYN domain-containing protein, partial [Pyrinomonadaceae bacterium]|nr:NYN domain-containing protein [Pyrinomonadaceae bacterium]